MQRWRTAWRALTALLSLLVALTIAALAMPVQQLAQRGGTLPTAAPQLLAELSGLRRDLPRAWRQYRRWAANDRGAVRWMLAAAATGSLATSLWLGRRNPFPAVPPVHGDARLAGASDLRRIERRGLAALRPRSSGDGLLHLGLLRDRCGRRRRLLATETLSALVIAPPGSGKTAGCVVPAILTADRASFVVHDLKPEIAARTGGWRARLGPVFILDWAAPDGGARYPCWNPLSPGCVPPRGGGRDLYLDRLVHVLIPETGAADPFWPRKAQAMLCGCLQYLIARINDRDDPQRYDGLPPEWRGAEASLPLLLDWLTEGQLGGPDAAAGGDPLQAFLRRAIDEARAHDYPRRAVQELADLAGTADRTRDGIVATLTAHLVIFRNQSVRERTGSSDLRFADLRGVRDDRGTWQPCTVYLCTRQEDARALAVINALFIELLTAWLLSTGPGEMAADGAHVGPYNVCFALDELPQLPQLEAALAGPATGRSKGVSFLMVAQDLAQLEVRYGREQVAALQTNCAFVLVFNQNNFETARALSDRIGPYTHVKVSRTENAGSGTHLNAGGDAGRWRHLFADRGNHSLGHSYEALPLLTPQALMSVPAGVHYVLVQGWNHRPIRARKPLYFRDPILRRRSRIDPPPPMPPGHAPALAGTTATRPAGTSPAIVSAPGIPLACRFLVAPTDLAGLVIAGPDLADPNRRSPGWGGVRARRNQRGWTITGFAGDGGAAGLVANAAGGPLILFDHSSRQALEALLERTLSCSEYRCLSDLRRAVGWPTPRTLAEAAATLLPALPDTLDPDMAAILLLELMPPDRPPARQS